MKSYSSREVIKMLKEDGWYEVNVEGSHHQFKHPTKKGRTTIKHPDKDIPRKTLDSIERQSGLVFRWSVMKEDYYEKDRSLLLPGSVFL